VPLFGGGPLGVGADNDGMLDDAGDGTRPGYAEVTAAGRTVFELR
jgi:hypothetical protein